MEDKICLCGISDRGNVRPDNQDAILINGIIERNELEMKLSREGLFFKHHGLLCAVADGIGGHKGGAMASHQALLALSIEMLCMSSCSDIQVAKEYLDIVVHRLHRSMIEQGKLNPGFKGMGTTLTGVYMKPDWGFYFHAGDSRLYRFRRDFLVQLSTDHVLENISGIQVENINTNAKSGIITNCIGGGSSVCSMETGDLSLEHDDILMICSDGLNDMLSVEKIEQIITDSQEDLVQASKNLVAAAKKAGGHDNISLILIGNQQNGGK